MEPKIKSDSILSKLSQQLRLLERRDSEQWIIVVGTSALAGIGLVSILFRGVLLRNSTVHFEVSVSRQLIVALVVLLMLFNTYMISSRVKLRRARSEVISSAIQSELLRLQSFSDPLTEVYNRRSFDDMLKRYCSRAERLKKPLSVMMIDVDDFHDINSRFGHTTGDFVLLEVATILESAVRGSDAVIRYGGDEFLVLLADAPLEDVPAVTARINRFMLDWNQCGHLKNVDLVLSVGAAAWVPGKSVDELLNEADQNMYATKARGKLNRSRSA